jgi:hypothetical protein
MTKRALGVRTQSYSKCSLLYTVPQRIPPQRERETLGVSYYSVEEMDMEEEEQQEEFL